MEKVSYDDREGRKRYRMCWEFTAWSGTQSVGLASPSSSASQLTSLVDDSTPDLAKVDFGSKTES